MSQKSTIAVLTQRPSALSRCIAPLVCLAILAAALPADAEQAVPEFHAGEIVVSANALGVEQATTVRTVTAEDIDQRGARTLNEAIALLPGVMIRTGGDGIPRIQVRGLETRHVKILLDGIPLNSTFDGNVDPTIIPVEQIARIKLSAGSSSMLYGHGDLGGAINIITRKGAGDAHISSAGFDVGEGQQHRAWGALSGASGPLDYFISIGRQESKGFRLSNDFAPTALQDGNIRLSSDLNRNNFYANLGYAASELWSFGLISRHTDGNYGLPPSTLATTDPFATKAKYERIDGLRADSLQLTADFAPNAAWSGRGWLYYNAGANDDNSYDNANFNSVSNAKLNNTFQLHNETRINGGHLQTSYRSQGFGAVTLAADGRNEAWDSAGMVHDASSSGGNFKARNVAYAREIGVQSAALEYVATPIARLDVTAGYSHYRQTRDNDPGQNADGYLMGVAYAVSEATSLRIAASQHVRFPTISQLYDAASGNPGLKTETARNKEVGATHRLAADTQLSLAFFHNDVYNYIEKDTSTNKYLNFDHYRFMGLELGGETRFGDALRLRVSYTQQQSDNLSAGTPFMQLQYRPRHKVSLEADGSLGNGVTGYASLLSAADQYYYSRTTPLQQAQLNNYTLLNFKVSKRLAEKNVSLYLGANNLLDRNYETAYGFPQAGRFVYAGLQYGL